MIKKAVNNVVLVAIMFSFFACSPQWQAERLAKYCANCPQTSNTIIETIYRDSTVYLPPDSSFSIVVVKCDSGKPVLNYQETIKGNKIKQQINTQNISKGLQIKVSSNIKPDSFKVKNKETIKQEKTVINATVPCPPCVLSKWNKFLIRSGYAFYALLTIFCLLKVAKIYFKINSGMFV